MSFEKMIREAEKRRERDLRRQAKKVHRQTEDGITAGINELHLLVSLSIPRKLVETGDLGRLETAILEAVNGARIRLDIARPELAETQYRIGELMSSHLDELAQNR